MYKEVWSDSVKRWWFFCQTEQDQIKYNAHLVPSRSSCIARGCRAVILLSVSRCVSSVCAWAALASIYA